MHIKEFYGKGKLVISFEFMPPRNGENISKVYDAIKNLLKYNPSFVTVTQGSESSLRGGTAGIVSEIKRRFKIDAVSHMISINKSAKDAENELVLMHYLGIDNIMALRGDPPWGEDGYAPREGCLQHACQLIEEIKRKNCGKYILRGNDKKFFKLDENAQFRDGEKTNFCIGVAGYPEGHKECKDKIKNIEYLKLKVDAGADLIFTQMCYDFSKYEEFVRDCRKAGINKPIIPGLLPITIPGQINFIQKTCAVEIPKDYFGELEKNKENSGKMEECSVSYIAGLAKKLIKHGVPGLHFYTLNNWQVTESIMDRLKIIN